MHYRTNTCSLAPPTPLCTDALSLPHSHLLTCAVTSPCVPLLFMPALFLPVSPHVFHTDVPSYIILMWQASRKAHVSSQSMGHSTVGTALDSKISKSTFLPPSELIYHPCAPMATTPHPQDPHPSQPIALLSTCYPLG